MFLGIDIAKVKFDAALVSKVGKPRHKVFNNTPAGFQQLADWLTSNAVEHVHACLEATGTYGEALALFLHERGHQVSIVNPAIIRAFGQSQLSRTKTDKADAALIARFCQMHQPAAWTPPPVEARELQALVRRLEALEQMRQMESNRLQAGVGAEPVKTSIEATLAFLDEQLQTTRRLIQEHIEAHPTLREQSELLVSIPGIAGTTAAVLLAELLEAKQFSNAGQVAAFAGLVPRLRESGSSVRGRPCLSKVGSSRLRKALYFPAMVALRFNPLVRALGERLRQRSKSKMLILGAAMRKLLSLAYGVLKSGKRFDPAFAAKAA